MRSLLCLSVVAVTACSSGGGGGGGSSADKPPAASDSFTCSVFVKNKTDPVITGRGDNADEAKATDAAWKAACDQLPASERASCDGYRAKHSVDTADKWRVSVTTGKDNHSASVSVEVTLTPQIGADGSAASEDLACKAALVQACKLAGSSGDCVASGAYEQLERSTLHLH